MHQLRLYDFRRGQRLGAGDHVVVWTKPHRPDWMDADTYASIPETLTLREMRLFVSSPGCRAKELVIVSTMTDRAANSKDELLDLYHDRWHVELDIEAIKQSLQMDVLRCKSPEMLHNEIWAHLLAYNLVRKVMAQAALKEGIHPRTISFMGALQTLQEFRTALVHASDNEFARLAAILLDAIASHRVGNRPGRYEPRAVKRRPKEYDRLMKPRRRLGPNSIVESVRTRGRPNFACNKTGDDQRNPITTMHHDIRSLSGPVQGAPTQDGLCADIALSAVRHR